jgi:hypothetical protein
MNPVNHIYPNYQKYKNAPHLPTDNNEATPQIRKAISCELKYTHSNNISSFVPAALVALAGLAVSPVRGSYPPRPSLLFIERADFFVSNQTKRIFCEL